MKGLLNIDRKFCRCDHDRPLRRRSTPSAWCSIAALPRPRSFFNLWIDNAFLLITSIGMTFVILSGGIDLSVGAVIAFTTVFSAFLLQNGVSAPRS
jgi:ribose/xylose/arabinose/galactoside ABC-type transport system permease subunit